MTGPQFAYSGVALLAGMHCFPCAAATTQTLYAATPAPQPSAYQRAPEGVSFKSQKLPAWTLRLQQHASSPQPALTRLLMGLPTAMPTFSVVATRTLPASFEHHLAASITASPYSAHNEVDWLLLPEDAGMAATVGWIIGDPSKFNMAIEVEHRELGQDKEITSLTIGVSYYF